jgi:Spy/CpxP family protein refolding chaperone
MKRIALFASIAILLFSSIAAAQPSRDDRRQARERLNLSVEQEKSIKDIKTTSGKELIDLRADVQKKRIDLGNAWSAEAPDRAQVEGLMKDIGALQLKMKMILFDADQAVNKQLNPEQRKVYRELKQERREHMKDNAMQRRGGGKGFGPRRGGAPGDRED